MRYVSRARKLRSGRAETSRGSNGHLGKRNSPSVYNAAGLFAQFWDGRVAHLEEQAREPMLGSTEMAMVDEAHVVAALRSSSYEGAFRAAFPGGKAPVTLDNASIAIGAFERGLLTPGRWDRYLTGDKDALSPAERNGAAHVFERRLHGLPYRRVRRRLDVRARGRRRGPGRTRPTRAAPRSPTSSRTR